VYIIICGICQRTIDQNHETIDGWYFFQDVDQKFSD